MPAQIATTVDRIVGARKSFSKGLPDAPAVPRQDFVSTLEQVRDILKPRAEEAALPRPAWTCLRSAWAPSRGSWSTRRPTRS